MPSTFLSLAILALSLLVLQVSAASQFTAIASGAQMVPESIKTDTTATLTLTFDDAFTQVRFKLGIFGGKNESRERLDI